MVTVDRLDAMTVFVAVADLRGFAPAARRLGLSASAVTRFVAALEDHLSIRLLQRTTRSVTLTDAGARYLERARRILADVSEAEDAAQAERSEPTGHFVVSAPNVFGRVHVASLMSTYLSRYPAVTGELTLSDRNVNLVEDGVDAAVRIGHLEDSTLFARKVGETRRVLVASPAYLARHKRRPKAPADLSTHHVIHLRALSPTPHWDFFHDGEAQRLALAPSFVTNSADAAIGYAEAGGGVTMVLAYQVRDLVRAGRLEVVLAKHEPAPLPIHVVYPSTRLLSAKVRAFVDLVVSTTDWHFVEL